MFNKSKSIHYMLLLELSCLPIFPRAILSYVTPIKCRSSVCVYVEVDILIGSIVYKCYYSVCNMYLRDQSYNTEKK